MQELTAPRIFQTRGLSESSLQVSCLNRSRLGQPIRVEIILLFCKPTFESLGHGHIANFYI